jgi:hypothetical protein
MRRALILAALGILAAPAAAIARPAVTLSGRVVPIPGFPHTGNILGAGAAVEVHFTISGSEIAPGVPSQLRAVNFYLPRGAKLHPRGFVTCSPTTLENRGPAACPKKSQAGPVGSVGVVDPIGGELVHEQGTVQAFFAPGGGLEFYTRAGAPISAELIAASGHFITAARPYGPALMSTVRLVDTVPGAPPVSTTSINIKVGAAYRSGRKTVYYGTVPTSCPRGGFPVKAELRFQSGETTTVTARAACPRGRTRRA